MPTLFIDSVSKRYERNRLALCEFSLRMESGVGPGWPQWSG